MLRAQQGDSDAFRTLVEGLIDLKGLRGSVAALIERDAYRHVYIRSTSHWLISSRPPSSWTKSASSHGL